MAAVLIGKNHSSKQRETFPPPSHVRAQKKIILCGMSCGTFSPDHTDTTTNILTPSTRTNTKTAQKQAPTEAGSEEFRYGSFPFLLGFLPCLNGFPTVFVYLHHHPLDSLPSSSSVILRTSRAASNSLLLHDCWIRNYECILYCGTSNPPQFVRNEAQAAPHHHPRPVA